MPRTVLYLQYTNPAAYPPLQHSAEILAGHGWNVRLLGVAHGSVARLKFSSNPAIHVTLVPDVPPGWRQKLHYISFMVRGLMTALACRADWIYVSDALMAPAGFLASWLPRTSVIYHEHDTPSVNAPSLFMHAVLAFRRRLLARAQLVVLPNEGRAAAIPAAALDRRRLRTVWNCPQTREARGEPRPASTDEDLWLVYHGSIVPARLPHAVVEALALLPPSVKLRVSGYETQGHTGYTGELRRLAASLGATDRLDIRLAVPTREELLASVNRSDVGLALMPVGSGDVNEQHMTGASNKAFEYLAQGVPLLVGDLPDWRSMFVDRGLARVCRPDNPRSIADAITWFNAHRDEARAMGERGRRLVIESWNYERQFQPVLDVMSGG